MTWATGKEAADALRAIVRDPHPSKVRKAINPDSILVLIDLLDPPPIDDPVRDAAVAVLESSFAANYRRISPFKELAEALAAGPPSTAFELIRTRGLMAMQGGQLFRLGAALKLARTFGLSEVALPGTEVVRRFLRGWIDDGTWPPLAWPDAGALPDVSKWLSDQGYANIDGRIGVWLTANRDDPQLGRDFAL